MKNVEVVAAIIIKDNKVLAVQKGQAKKDYMSFKWEFPGGKIELDETPEEALKREIHEELNITIEPEYNLITVHHCYPDFHLTMHCFISKFIEGEVVLHEHIKALWLDVNQLNTLDWAEADLPVVKELQDLF